MSDSGNVGPVARSYISRVGLPAAGGFFVDALGGDGKSRSQRSVMLRGLRIEKQVSEVLLSESEVEKILRRHLRKHGFAVKPRSGTHGVDIFARDGSGRELFVEVEGNQKPDGSRLSASQRYTHLLRAVGQISTRMVPGSRTAVYAIGLPADPYYLKTVHAKLTESSRRLRLKFIWVGAEGVVVDEKPHRE